MKPNPRLAELECSPLPLGFTRIKALEHNGSYHAENSHVKAKASGPKTLMLHKHMKDLCPTCWPHISVVAFNGGCSLARLVQVHSELMDLRARFISLAEGDFDSVFRTFSREVCGLEDSSVRKLTREIASSLGWMEHLESIRESSLEKAKQRLTTDFAHDLRLRYAGLAFPEVESFHTPDLFKSFTQEQAALRESFVRRAAEDTRLFLVYAGKHRQSFQSSRNPLFEAPEHLYKVSKNLMVVPAAIAQFFARNNYEVARVGKKSARPEVFETVEALYRPHTDGPYSTLSGALKAAQNIERENA